MHTIEIPEKAITVSIPSHWDECTPAQTNYILGKAFDVLNGKMSIFDFRVHIFMHLANLKLGWKYHVQNRLGKAARINERIYHLSEQLCDWVFHQRMDGSYELKYDTVINHFDVLLEKYHGPADLLADVTFGEFKTALSFLSEISDQDTDAKNVALDYFIATLYRPKGKDGKRVAFHNYIIEPEIFKNVPIWKKQAIVLWFTYCIHTLQSTDLTINGIDVNFEPLFPRTTNNDNRHSGKTNLGWTAIQLDIAEAGVYGNATETSQTLLYDILLYLLKKHQDNEHMKKQMKK